MSDNTPLLALGSGLPEPFAEPEPVPGIIAALAEQGWCVTPDFLAPALVDALRHELEACWQAGGFRHAGVGRGAQLQVRPEVRTDCVHWLDAQACGPAQRRYLDELERLRLAINGTLFLGLFDFEAHLAVYPAGTYYRRHLDQFAGIGTRRVTSTLYLNADWLAADGGQLRIYTDPDVPGHAEDVLPLGGTLVTFLSARFLHEVLPARRSRMSITGWFRTRET
ncbi:MAG TPA: 2OG-Fe(II) oxygenase [Gammaproteobacteria bacterium]|nr:2OG-Fe(II) oxygenase [Gammaproteobacteria bacterium]